MYNLVICEVKWTLGAAIAGIAFVVLIVLTEDRPGPGWPTGSEWLAPAIAAWLVITLCRLLWWLARGRARQFKFWPEVFLVGGVALLAYSGAGLLRGSEWDSDTDRAILTLGAAITVIGALARRRHGP